MNSALYVLNFYSPIFVDQLRSGRKTATIRLGDKSRKYKRGQVVWITVGYRHQPREKIFAAVIDDVEVKKVQELSPRDIEHDNPEFRRREETVDFLETIYTRPIGDDDTVTVIRFSQIVERPSTQFGNGETPSRN
ncbi:MAG TPA: ASCH domain-containing protein [Solirubrobacterales bacterium]|nr:ASCH domain-containing protein [Solirubrobacterales bacterium]